jgi:hypothetical protein
LSESRAFNLWRAVRIRHGTQGTKELIVWLG